MADDKYDISQPFSLPPRIPLPVVLELAGYSKSTLQRRQAEGTMPGPIDRGGSGGIYDRDAVLKSLGITRPDELPKEASDPWKFNREAFRALYPRKNRRQPSAPMPPDRPDENLADSGPDVPPAPEPPVLIRKSLIPVPRMVPKGLPRGPKDLGKYVVLNKRVTGGFAVYFQVSKRLRPKGWRATIRLPLDEPRTGNLSDKDEVARIRSDAKALFLSMHRERLAQARQAQEASKTTKKQPDAE